MPANCPSERSEPVPRFKLAAHHCGHHSGVIRIIYYPYVFATFGSQERVQHSWVLATTKRGHSLPNRRLQEISALKVNRFQ